MVLHEVSVITFALYYTTACTCIKVHTGGDFVFSNHLVANETLTKRERNANETKRNRLKKDETKRNETKRNKRFG